MLERGQIAQEFQPFLAVEADVDESFAARHDTAEDRQQDLVERMEHLCLLSRIGDGRGKGLKGCGFFP